MDERVFYIKKRQPIPSWDLQHRLSIDEAAGPTAIDNGTTFRINSTFMDVSDQPHMIRQWLAGGTLVGCFSFIMFFYSFIFLVHIYAPRIWEPMDTGISIFVLLTALFFGATTIFLGHHEFFALARRPIRFNRVTKKIYAIRHKRWFDKKTKGDIFWEFPWDHSSIFCVHKGPAKFELDGHYHIRCYQLDDSGNVLRGFAIGKDWQGTEGLCDLLAQWNYWCFYMNKGPAELPKPMLYLAEFENTVESFLYCLYEIGFNLPGIIRIMFMPFILVLTSHRLMSLWTCRQPIWPQAVLDVSQVSKDDPFDQPSGNTPVGWAETIRAHREGSYPENSSRQAENWTGEPDPLKNALLWKKDQAPTTIGNLLKPI